MRYEERKARTGKDTHDGKGGRSRQRAELSWMEMVKQLEAGGAARGAGCSRVKNASSLGIFQRCSIDSTPVGAEFERGN